MKVMLLSFVAIAIIGVGSSLILGQAGFSTQERATGSSVRLDN